MADKTVAELHFTNGVLAEPEGGGPIEVFFLHYGDDRRLSDILADAFARCKQEKVYCHIAMTLRFKTGVVVIKGPPDSEVIGPVLKKALAERDA